MTLVIILATGFEFQFIDEPADVIANVGDTVQFNCAYTGSSELPYWFINGLYFPVDRLPQRHFFHIQNFGYKMCNYQIIIHITSVMLLLKSAPLESFTSIKLTQLKLVSSMFNSFKYMFMGYY